jgi:hypothetical protein
VVGEGKMSKVIEKTLPLRHWMVKKIAPRLWNDGMHLSGTDSLELKRPAISFMKEQFGEKPLVGCEIGVREGLNALRMLRNLNIRQLFLIDPYKPYYEPLFPETSTEAYHEKIKSEAMHRLKNYESKIVWITDTSDAAINHIKVPLDFCYIDGDHSYDQVKRDTENYGQLIQSGGVLSGHDFSTEYIGLCQALFEYKDKHANWSELKGSIWDWWFVKQ